jgi:hypothetical protein
LFAFHLIKIEISSFPRLFRSEIREANGKKSISYGILTTWSLKRSINSNKHSKLWPWPPQSKLLGISARDVIEHEKCPERKIINLFMLQALKTLLSGSRSKENTIFHRFFHRILKLFLFIVIVSA